ncbi:MAG: serine hydrolase [Candidatus Thorarchaeota archaeon]|nr:serine hydrolase [Candidatus Thorarchaeota archaeon]
MFLVLRVLFGGYTRIVFLTATDGSFLNSVTICSDILLSSRRKSLHMMGSIDENNVAIQGIVVVRNGYVVLEEYPGVVYDENSTHLLYSVTKSFTSALIGIAIDQGFIDNVSVPMLSFFPDYEITNVDERRERITIEHLLTMRS